MIGLIAHMFLDIIRQKEPGSASSLEQDQKQYTIREKISNSFSDLFLVSIKIVFYRQICVRKPSIIGDLGGAKNFG